MAACLGFALHELVQEGGEGQVPEGVPIIAHKGAGQQRARKGRHAGVHMTPQAAQLPPARPVPPTELWLPMQSHGSVLGHMSGHMLSHMLNTCRKYKSELHAWSHVGSAMTVTC